jgi:cysteine desulfurase family protein
MDTDTQLVYMDNGATSFPKPPGVAEAMVHFLHRVGGSPGRSGHRLSQDAARIVFSCREALAGLFGAPDSRRIVFTLNATEALNIAILGLLRKGDRVVTTSVEHNSVMRPLRDLSRRRRIDLQVIPGDQTGRIDPNHIEQSLQSKPRLLVVSHASNVTGALIPLPRIGEMSRAAGTLFLLDAAQSAGVVPIDVERDKVDLIAFTGHKGLLGPQGTGGLWVREGVEVRPLVRGGTGSNSELEEQPDFYPDALESGTQNAVGLAGLEAAVRYITDRGVEEIGRHEKNLAARLIEGLRAIDNLTLHGPGPDEPRTSIVSLTVRGVAPSEAPAPCGSRRAALRHRRILTTSSMPAPTSPARRGRKHEAGRGRLRRGHLSLNPFRTEGGEDLQRRWSREGPPHPCAEPDLFRLRSDRPISHGRPGGRP